MKLSDLEALVQAARVNATERGVEDPNVGFWITSKGLHEGNSQSIFTNFVVDPNATEELGDHICIDGSFSFPLEIEQE